MKKKKKKKKKEKKEKTKKSFKDTSDVNRPCFDEALKITLNKQHIYWRIHCSLNKCLTTKTAIDKLLHLKTDLNLTKREKNNKRASLKQLYRKAIINLPEDCRIFCEESYKFVRNLMSIKYNTNILEGSEIVKNGNGIWLKEINKTLTDSNILKKKSKELKIKPHELKAYMKNEEIIKRKNALLKREEQKIKNEEIVKKEKIKNRRRKVNF